MTTQAVPAAQPGAECDDGEPADPRGGHTQVAPKTDPIAAGTGDSTFVPGTIDVSDTRTGALTSRNILTSVDRVDAEHIENQNARSPWELFGQSDRAAFASLTVRY